MLVRFGVRADLAVIIGALIFIPAAIAVALRDHWLTKPLAVCFPRSSRTLGELTRTVTANNYGRLAAQASACSPHEVWDIFQGILVETLGVRSDAITANARLVEDLGVD
jgi:hypothetical protein